MRLHHLEITAFGPFADAVAVDFDALSSGGLFLLTGATGAGKTSVLDAVCFALYGDVPGDRSTARRLRSDHADPAVPPRVVLEATLRGRRFRFTRSPAWVRPKKRGSGTTPQQAAVTVAERVDGAWVTHTTRLDEAGHLVGELVGLTLTQFTQVALLPQGRFQEFLRSRSEDRQQLLQRLFRTARFEEMERWLADRRRDARARSAAHETRLAETLSRFSEAAGEDRPWPAEELALAAEGGEITAWAAAAVHDAQERSSAAREAAEAMRDARAEAEAALMAATGLADRQRRHTDALAARARLDAAAPAQEERRGRLESARRAVATEPLHRVAEEAATALAAAEADRARLLADLPAPVDPTAPPLRPEPGVLEAAAHAFEEAAAAALSLVPVAEAARRLRGRLEADRQRLDQLTARQREVADRRGRLPARLTALRTDVSVCAEAATRLPAVAAGVLALRERLEAASSLERLAAERAEAAAARSLAVDTAQTLREGWLQLQEQRITGMAAELAGALAVGDSCPVCGSCEHPHPAVRAHDAPDAAAVRAARRRLDDAEAVRHAHDDRLRELDTRVARAEQAAGGADVATLTAELQQAAEREAELASRAAGQEAAGRLLVEAESEAEALTAEAERLGHEVATLSSSVAARQEEHDDARRRVLDALRDSGCTDLAELADRHRRRARRCRRAVEALGRVDDRRRSAQRARRRWGRAATGAGFPDGPAALAAWLPPDELEALDLAVRTTDAERVAVEQTLAEPDLVDAAGRPAPDLERLVAAAEATREAAHGALAAASLAERQAARLATLDTELRAALERWRPVRAELALATRLAGLAEGRSGDNRWQMRLSAYVLGYRLRQVVAAANARLAGMSDRRYSLQHSERRRAGETRGGLGLVVRDDWTGETRDTATLSGGETFVVSLALALGLADVITDEAGGAELDTLIVDEGFGSLDADTLDDVLDVLDALRDGGRVVGVVSHVPEMRDRIPVQLAVAKGRHGSTVSLRPAAGAMPAPGPVG